VAEIDDFSEKQINALQDGVIDAWPKEDTVDAALSEEDQRLRRVGFLNHVLQDPAATRRLNTALRTAGFYKDESALKSDIKKNPHFTNFIAAELANYQFNPEATQARVNDLKEKPIEIMDNPSDKTPPQDNNAAAAASIVDQVNAPQAEAPLPAATEDDVPVPQPMLATDEEPVTQAAPEGVPVAPTAREAQEEQDMPGAQGDPLTQQQMEAALAALHASQTNGQQQNGQDQTQNADHPQRIDWSQHPYIFSVSEADLRQLESGTALRGTPDGINRVHKQATEREPERVEYENIRAIDGNILGYVCTRFPSYGRDPLFLRAVAGLAARLNMSVEDLLKAEKVPMLVDGETQMVPLNDALTGAFKKSILLHKHFANSTHKLQGMGVITKSTAKQLGDRLLNLLPFIERSQDKVIGIMAVDEKANAYFDIGGECGVILAPGEKFSAEHASNVMSMYFSGRFDRSGKMPQPMTIKLTGGHALSRILGHHGKDGHQLSLLVIDTLAKIDMMEKELGQPVILPTIEFQGMPTLRNPSGFQTLGRIYTKNNCPQKLQPGDLVVSDDALAEWRAKGVDGLALIDQWNGDMPVNKNVYKNEGPAAFGDELGEAGNPQDPQGNEPGGAAEAVDPIEAIEDDIEHEAQDNPALTSKDIAAMPFSQLVDTIAEPRLKEAHPSLGGELHYIRAEMAGNHERLVIYDGILQHAKMPFEQREKLLYGDPAQLDAYMQQKHPEYLQNFYPDSKDETVQATAAAERARVESQILKNPSKDGNAVPAFDRLHDKAIEDKYGPAAADQVTAISKAAYIAQAAARIQDLIETGTTLPDMPKGSDLGTFYNELKKDQATLASYAKDPHKADEVKNKIPQSQLKKALDLLHSADLSDTAHTMAAAFQGKQAAPAAPVVHGPGHAAAAAKRPAWPTITSADRALRQ